MSKYMSDGFKELLTHAVDDGTAYDRADSAAWEFITLPLTKPITYLLTIVRETITGHPQKKLRDALREETKAKAAASTNALFEYIIDVAQTHRAEAIRMAWIASRYAFAKAPDGLMGFVTGKHMQSGRNVTSSSFSVFSHNLQLLADLESHISIENGSITQTTYYNSKSFTPQPKDWKVAAFALFDIIRRQDPPRGLTRSLFDKTLQGAPKATAEAIVRSAQRRVVKKPGHSREFVKSAETRMLKYG